MNQEAVDVTGPGVPVDFFVFPADCSHDLKPPFLSLRVGESQAFKGDGHFNGIPRVISFGIGKEKSIPAPVESEESSSTSSSSPSPDLCVDSVNLNTAGIHLEDESSLFIVECIQVDRDIIVTVNRISFGEAGPDSFGVGIKTADSDV